MGKVGWEPPSDRLGSARGHGRTVRWPPSSGGLAPKKWLALAAFAALPLLSALPIYCVWSFYRQGPSEAETTVLIRKGMTVGQAAEELHQCGTIRSKRLFRYWARATGLRLLRGEYVFGPRASMADVAKKFARGEVHITKLVVTPSLHGWSLQKRLEPYIPPDAFWNLWTSPRLAELAGFPDAPSLEGLIAPATYNINHAMEPEEILQAMVESFRSHVLPALADGVLPPYETLILASLAEKETNLPEELPHIAGVYYKRLNVPMRLQCDPTSLYARWMSGDIRFTPPMRDDTARSHPYNTYSVMGLPPGPIAIPSMAAIEAAKSPMETDDIFFVATGSGGHNFSKTLKEHNRNVGIYRTKMGRQRTAAAPAQPRPSAKPQPTSSAKPRPPAQANKTRKQPKKK
jgi:UPF0755 protein